MSHVDQFVRRANFKLSSVLDCAVLHSLHIFFKHNSSMYSFKFNSLIVLCLKPEEQQGFVITCPVTNLSSQSSARYVKLLMSCSQWERALYQITWWQRFHYSRFVTISNSRKNKHWNICVTSDLLLGVTNENCYRLIPELLPKFPPFPEKTVKHAHVHLILHEFNKIVLNSASPLKNNTRRLV